MGFPSKTQIWEDCCNRPDDVDSRSDALIHKASRAFKIQMSRCQSSWSGRASYLYGNCVQLKYDHPDDRATLSGRGSNQERISAKFWKADCTVVHPDALCLPSIRCLGFIKPDTQLNLQPINRGP
jgi:hypothetical protein